MIAPTSQPAQRVEHLHGLIDHGLTGDKVGAVDPAASPLGSDDEAAGTPPTQARIRLTQTREREIGQQVREAEPISNAATWVWIIAALALMGIAILSFVQTS